MLKIPQYLAPALLLTTIILNATKSNAVTSFSNLDPESLDFDGQEHDNNSHLEKLKYLLYNVPMKSSKYAESQEPDRIQLKYFEKDQDFVDKDEIYNGEGFRKEQWHNYPRQMDRLHRFIFKNHKDKKNNDELPLDDNTALEFKDNTDVNTKDIFTNEFLVNNNVDMHNIYDAVIATTNPLLVLKIRLASLDDLRNAESDPISYPSTLDDNGPINVIKVKRDENDYSSEVADQPLKARKDKRIFSLWSRLQSLSHNGHELHHRRHFHAFYGLPDDGNEVLTAETRALMRPPGSPLRWG